MRYIRRNKDKDVMKRLNKNAGNVPAGNAFFNGTFGEAFDEDEFTRFELEDKLQDILDNAVQPEEELRTFRRIARLLGTEEYKASVLVCEKYTFLPDKFELVDENYELKKYQFTDENGKKINFVYEQPHGNAYIYLYFNNEEDLDKYIAFIDNVLA